MSKKKEKGKKEKSWKEMLRERQIKHQRALEAYRVQREIEAERKPRKRPKGVILMAFCLLVLIFGVYGVWQFTRPSTPSEEISPSQTPPQTSSYEAIYIKSNGTIYPSTAPISNLRNTYYTFRADIDYPIVVERDNIIIDGAGYTIQGKGIDGSKGIDLTRRVNVTVKNVQIKGFSYGVYMDRASGNVISKNNLTNNYCGVWLTYFSNNNKIISNIITNTTLSEGYGIWLKNSSENNIVGNKITLYTYGVYVGSSTKNTFSENNIANNTLGIYLYSSVNNTISANIVANNRNGVHFLQSSNNTVDGNTIANNTYGIGFDSSSNNIIYHNNFIDNSEQVYSYTSKNIWDHGYPDGGNYWSDYNGADGDGDGIGDTQYFIDDDNQDRYPLMSLKR
jgi:parallel beta-helix repeat protein